MTAAPLASSARSCSRGWIGVALLLVACVAAGAYFVGRSTAASRAEAPAVDIPGTAGPAVPATAAAVPPRAAPPAASPAVPACEHCGVVESVQAVQHKGSGTGVGAVAGGVVGGALGHQVGAGSGRTAMTVLGAVAGGVAGHEIEKRVRSTSVYRVRVRLDDGQVRTIERSQAPAVGQRVELQGSRLQVLPANGSAPTP